MVFSPLVSAKATGCCRFPLWEFSSPVLWFLIIKSHADLNRVKFNVIHEFEQHLPAAMYKS